MIAVDINAELSSDVSHSVTLADTYALNDHLSDYSLLVQMSCTTTIKSPI